MADSRPTPRVDLQEQLDPILVRLRAGESVRTIAFDPALRLSVPRLLEFLREYDRQTEQLPSS